MTDQPENIFISCADTATEYGVKITEALKPEGYPRHAIEYVRADLARPVTVAEAAKVLLDASYEDPVGYSDLLAKQPFGGVHGLQRSLRALSHEGGE